VELTNQNREPGQWNPITSSRRWKCWSHSHIFSQSFLCTNKRAHKEREVS